MIGACWQYLRDEARPRLASILSGSELWLAVGVGIVVGFFSNGVISGVKPIEPIANALLTYAAIAFGFCLAGLTLALTLPDASFAKKLACSKSRSRKTDAYSDLLFVFSWTAICHWLLILSLLLVSALSGPNEMLIPPDAGRAHRVYVALIAAVSMYGVLQFLITLITLSQVGRAYIESLSRDQSKDSSGK